MEAAIPTLMSFLNYLRPSKSPLLIVTIVCIVALYLPSKEGNVFDVKAPLLFFPVYAVLFAIVALSFHFRTLKVENDATITADTDEQFKFARAVGLSFGVGMLLLLCFDGREASDLVFNVSYAIVIVHIATFLGYMTFKNFSEEKAGNYAIIQIAFISTAVLCGAINLANQESTVRAGCLYQEFLKTDGSGERIFKLCGSTTHDGQEILPVEDTQTINFPLISWMYLCLLWLIYESFWIKQLLQFWRESQNASEVKLLGEASPAE